MRWIVLLCSSACLLWITATAAESEQPESVVEKKLPVSGEVFQVNGRTAFLIAATNSTTKPWVLYAPTLPAYPAQEEEWMFQQFLSAGISVAGIDVGESYGSPAGRKLFNDLHAEMVKRGFSPKPVLLGRSRGGLMTLNWAAENPEKVAAFAGIYPVCNLASYPGIAKAAPAYEMTPEKLESILTLHNPIDRLSPLAEAGTPLFAIHGDVDALVPLEKNSAIVKERYTAMGGKMELIVPPGQGHNMWTGFFQSHDLVRFVKAHAK